jgi:hypothetical protein
MNARHIAVVLLVSAFVVTSVASARVEATKQRVQIDMKVLSEEDVRARDAAVRRAQARLRDSCLHRGSR